MLNDADRQVWLDTVPGDLIAVKQPLRRLKSPATLQVVPQLVHVTNKGTIQAPHYLTHY